VTRGADESFVLTEAQENELLAAMAEIERGEYVTLEELLQSLPRLLSHFVMSLFDSRPGTFAIYVQVI
jgi:hypothetical protein